MGQRREGSRRPPAISDNDSQPPRYTQRYPSSSASSQLAEQTERTFKLDGSRGQPWMWLTVKSRAKDNRTWPLYYERDTIQGTVQVDFDMTDGARALSITVTAVIAVAGQDELSFLDISQDLWDSKTSGKPAGRHSWPFRIVLPTEASIAERPKAKPELYRLPPTFSERASPVFIDYKLVVMLRRSAFKVNQILTASFFYTPLTRAEPPSQLRQAAYIGKSDIIGPEGDPQGWKVFPPVNVQGTVFNSQSVTVECIVAIASPLSYATGSAIPLVITFSCPDEQALDILCAPSAIRLHLIRECLIGAVHTTKDTRKKGQQRNIDREIMVTASFWPSRDLPEAGKRRLQGELELRKSLRPTFVFPRLAVRYEVVMMPFEAPGFTPVAPDTALLTEGVDIHTVNAIGVVPRSYAPPGYEGSMKTTTTDYLGSKFQRFHAFG